MKMNKHTPGPWKIDSDDPYEIVSEDYGGIANVPNEPAENIAIMAEMRANAALIAKAPDLVAALKPFAALYAKRLDEMDDDIPLYQHCDAVIRVGDVRQARTLIAELEKRDEHE